ncbi:MAG: radical SAM/Cys-rich domain protein [Deltaproteobacteria bacterium]|nr:radical SAM/Cys-rich domain protein [Deltaproteobacteria bacterium]
MIEMVDPTCARFDTLRTLQLNLGNRCNLACVHCHVAASPQGSSLMGREVMDQVIGFLGSRRDVTLDITGGCPEMNPDFSYLIERTGSLGVRRIVRTNLAIAGEPGMERLPEFYRDNALALVASLPCFHGATVDRQRGDGTFQRSIATLRRLNDLGYGDSLELNLVYNPEGNALPGSQRFLESLYRKELMDRYGIRFTNLFTITNVPIGRFRDHLETRGELASYRDTLVERFNGDAAPSIMCRTLISVDWKGRLYNCDFNLAAGLPLRSDEGVILTVRQLAEAPRHGTPLTLGEHCFSCTAGEGSSCRGATIV